MVRSFFLGPLITACSVFSSLVLATTPTTNSTILVFARDSDSSYSATSGLNAYGIPYELVIVPSAGITLPTLNSSATAGNYGGFIIMSEVSYGYTDGWYSALTSAQWQAMYDYQTAFGVRMVRLDVYPTSDFGVQTAIAGQGCCDTNVEQLLSFSDTSAFSTANLKTGAGVSTQNLWHYPASIIDSSTTTEVAQFAANSNYTATTTAAVINNFGTREQMVWFISFATKWSLTSNFIQHAHIQWLTRGLFVGRRRVFFSTQVDDVQLATYLYTPTNGRFRLRTTDLDAHVTWQANLNSRLPAGSSYVMEMGHNGNGNIEWAINDDENSICNPAGMIDYEAPADTALEFQKVVGTGVDHWPTTPSSYAWSLACTQVDTLGAWFQVASNRDNFFHVSHTFSHENLNNATFSDVNKEITFNQAWFAQTGISSGKFSPMGLIPPAITGLHNGDAIRAFITNGIKYVVGDSSRPPLLNTKNEFWPLISTVSASGYSGLTIIPRWSNPIYYNCDLANCTQAEWVATSGGWGTFSDLLDFSRSTYTRYLLGLRHDPYMFHQANLRQGDTDVITVGTQTGSLSLIQIFTEVVLQELVRLTNWPVITLKHDEIGAAFNARMTLDQCAPNLQYILSADYKTITGVKVSTKNNVCPVSIPVTFPGSATGTSSSLCTTQESREQVGADPLTVWIPICGQPVTYTLTTPISLH